MPSQALIQQIIYTGPAPHRSTYFRSRLFSTPNGSNPLISAASPLFSLMERLLLSASLPPIHTLRSHIAHELLAFNSRLYDEENSNHYERNQIAHYLVCATIDEMVAKSYLRIYEHPEPFQSFSINHLDDTGPETHFFTLLDYIKERPNQYLELIELAYFCLVIGFEGIYHTQANGRQTLDGMLDELFQLIQRTRVNRALPSSIKTPPVRPLKRSYKSLILMIISIAFFTSSGLMLHQILLDSKIKQFSFNHQLH